MSFGLTRRVSILYVEGDSASADATATRLERADDAFSVETVSDTAAALDRLRETTVDCVVSEHDAPGAGDFEFLRTVRDERSALPVVLVVASADRAVTGDAVEAGATDCLLKQRCVERTGLLARRVGVAVRQYRSTRRLREARDEYAAAFENAQDGLLLVADEGSTFRYRRCNRRAATLIGRDREAVVGHTPRAALGPENGRKAVGAYRTCVDTGESVRYLLTLELPVGRRIRKCEVAPVESSDDPQRLVVTFRDITERREYRRKLRDERTFTEQALNALEDVFFVVGPDGSVRRWNDRLVAVTGHADETLREMAASELFAPPHRDRVTEAVETVRTIGRAVVEVEIATADGRRLPYELTAVRVTDTDGNPNGFVAIARDRRAQRERERVFESLKSQYEALVEHFPEGGVFLFDTDLQYVRAGGQGLAAVGLSPSEVEGATPRELFPADIADELVDQYRATLKGHERTAHHEYRGRWYRVHTLPVRDDEGDVIFGMVVSQDVTERREQRRQLERQNDRLEAFARVVGHDLRNPLQTASGRLELAATDADSDHVEEALKSVRRSQQLIDDLLTLARQGEAVGERTPVAVAKVVSGCWRRIETGDASLTTDCDLTVWADATRFRQLVENLCLNAVKHGGDDVTVTVGELDGGFYVADDGSGLPDGARDSVFDVGYSTAPEGTGFGLGIVAEVVDGHGWQIRATESDAGGARFEITGVDPVD